MGSRGSIAGYLYWIIRSLHTKPLLSVSNSCNVLTVKVYYTINLGLFSALAMSVGVPNYITKVENLGRKITLNDNSEWEVYFLDAIKSSLWLPTNRVVVRSKRGLDPWKVLTNAIYPYTTIIEHIDSGKMVGAKRLT